MELLFLTLSEPAASVKERVALARELGHDEILLLFPTHDTGNVTLAHNLSARAGLLVTDVATLRKKFITTYDEIAAPAKREFFESVRVTLILEPEAQARQDFIHHRNSGLHQVLLKLCQPTKRRREKRVITTTSLLLNARHPPTVILGRMLQNAHWCAKYQIPYLVTSGARTRWEQRDRACLDALARELGKKKG